MSMQCSATTHDLGPHGFPNSLLTLLQRAGAPTVTIDGQQYYFSQQVTLPVPSSNLSNFPALIVIPQNTLMAAASNGSDVRFTTSGGALLYHELITYANGGGIWYVNVQGISTSGTYIIMYFGSILQQQRALSWQALTWDANHAAVYHFVKNGALSLLDSTGNGNNFSRFGAPSIGLVTLAPGQQGMYFPWSPGGEFGSPQSYLEVAGSTSLNISGNNLTVEQWINPSTIPTTCYLLDKRTQNNPVSGYGFELASSYGYIFNLGHGSGASQQLISNSVPSMNANTYLVTTLNGTAYNLLKNNVSVLSGTTTNTLAEDSSPLYIANNPGGYQFEGIVFEVRISNIYRAAAWTTYIYNQLTSPTAGLTLGSINLV